MAYYGNPQPNWIAPQAYPTYPTIQQGYQSYAAPPQQLSPYAIQWVDGEVGAKAYQMPQGIAPGTPIALWDTNDQVIYLKSMNQMGMPNPLKKIHYTTDEEPTQYLPQGNMSGNVEPDMNKNYATKEDLESLKNEIKELVKSTKQNRGGTT